MSQADHAYRPSMAEVLQDREGQSGLLHVLGISLTSKQNRVRREQHKLKRMSSHSRTLT